MYGVDVYQLSRTEFFNKAFENSALYETIVNHRYKFTRVGDINYNLHRPKHINPIPPKDLIGVWKRDYMTMQEQMIYGDSPSFEEMLQSIKEFVNKINALDWEIKGDFEN